MRGRRDPSGPDHPTRRVSTDWVVGPTLRRREGVDVGLRTGGRKVVGVVGSRGLGRLPLPRRPDKTEYTTHGTGRP